MEAAVLVLSAYYLTAVLTRTDGPGGVFYRLRRYDWLPFKCGACTAFWTALLVCALFILAAQPALVVLAIAGAVTILDDLHGIW